MPTFMPIKHLVLMLALPFALGGCSLMPDYLRPGLPVPGVWPTGPAYASAAPAEGADQRKLAQLGWQDFFQSDEMRALIARGLVNNRNLREAALNIQAARAQYRIQRSELLPTVAAGASYARRNVSGSSPSAASGTSSQYEANVGITAFELDLFGRLRSLNESALETYFATEQARDSVQIALIAEIAVTYLTLVADRQQQLLSTQTLAAQQNSYDLALRRFTAGIGSKLDLKQAQTLLEAAKVDLIAFTRLIAQDRNALDLLVGATVTDAEVAARFVDSNRFMVDLPTGLPSDLLQNRPDIKEAEHLLRAANADIGAARAAFFPVVSLTGGLGTEGRSVSDLFSGGSGVWSFVPQVTAPIFTGGRNTANLELAKLRKEISIARYESAIQTAFREVADALAARGTLTDELATQQALVDATSEADQIAQARYDRGIDDYLTVLDARRSLYTTQQRLISTRLALLGNLVDFYQVVGGGVTAK